MTTFLRFEEHDSLILPVYYLIVSIEIKNV
jgi:hypothetical protein